MVYFFVCFFSEHAFWTSTDARCRSWTRLLLGHELPETFTFTFARLWTTRYMYINYYCRSWTTRARARQPSSAPGASRTCWPSCWILCPSPSYRLSRVSVLHNVKVKVVFKVRVNWVKSRSRTKLPDIVVQPVLQALRLSTRKFKLAFCMQIEAL